MLYPPKRDAISLIDLNLLPPDQRTLYTQNHPSCQILQNSILKHCPELEYYCSLEEYSKGETEDKDSKVEALQSPASHLNIGNILDSMFPPKKIEQKEGVFLQKVLGREVERHELHLIETQLQIKLGESKAKKSGICMEREELHNQLFDEVIRQVTINSPERGMLLFKVRDQIKMTLGSYKILHQGSIVFGH